MKKVIVRYTDSFKEHVIKELEEGVLKSYADAMRKYNIGGSMTIRKWIEKAGKSKLLYKVKVIDI